MFRNLKKKIYISFYVIIFLSSSLSVGFHVQIEIINSYLRQYVDQGEKLFSISTSNLNLLINLKEKIYNNTNYKEKYTDFLKEDIKKFLLVKNIKTLGKIDTANFDDIFQIFFYGNPCKEHLSLNIKEKTDCEILIGGKLKQGIASFINYFTIKMEDHLNFNNKFGEISNDLLLELDKCIILINKFMVHLLFIWNEEMQKYIDLKYNFILTFLISIISLLIITFIIAKKFLISILQNNYEFFKNVYIHQIPCEIVERERIIKARLAKANILKK